MNGSSELGFYGKMPSNGDFISRNLPRTFIEPWDQWLQESIATSREQLGKDWLNYYLTAPIWRFALSRGVCDNNIWIGILIPSVDQVGRYFPLTLAAQVNDSYNIIDIADNEEPWFSQAEHIALSALDKNNKLNTFNQYIDQLNLPGHLITTPKTQQDKIPEPHTANSDSWRVLMTRSKPVSANLSTLTEQLLYQRFENFSLWWTSGSEQIEASILTCKKLPQAHGFAAMLSGNWENWGWDNILHKQLPPGQIDLKTESEISS